VISRWFGAILERDRKRYRSALEALERDGMVTVRREEEGRLMNVALTEAGKVRATVVTGVKG
jgi:DNA-binding FadR family transcriptional regulator